MPGERAPSVHLLTLAPPIPERRDAELEAHWERLLKVRAEALKLLETMRQAGTIGAPLEAAVEIGAVGADTLPEALALAETFERYRDSLKELFIVSYVVTREFSPDDGERLLGRGGGTEGSENGVYWRAFGVPSIIVKGRRAPGRKCLRCWMYFNDDSGSDLDPRCRAVVEALNA
jgi:isoleucyl-tRNA synthetase